jgi:hypothetical protein
VWIGVGVMVVASTGVVVAVCLLIGASGFTAGFVVGASLTAQLAIVAWMSLEASGARSYAIGWVGESNTADELDRLGRDWLRIDNVPSGDLFDVDHVLVGPPGVFAVETKFTAVDWTLERGEPNLPLRKAITELRTARGRSV